MPTNLPTTPAESAIDYYAETNVTAAALTLLNHPIVHGIRVQNHMLAEGIPVVGERRCGGGARDGREQTDGPEQSTGRSRVD